MPIFKREVALLILPLFTSQGNADHKLILSNGRNQSIGIF
jgi:hypothetical protein